MQIKVIKVCLLVDNYSAHNIERSHLKCVDSLPPNTTLTVQPADGSRNYEKFSTLLSKENVTKS